ncbi:MAG: DASH family cryptochrome [Phaeodactylibacter xiamenensis]|uniref:DASH family cryptochrome n=1 Tax=Phaeodactylibacter xiamenensis TaxID=1524460 RepID=UPI0005C493CD|nr:DASH family cryptochrome [Phaeodactylibacter xiamenensis]MCR9052653.1 DASH family cryptochrome [bacterium]
MYTKRGIVWFRQDLRLHDNEALHDAINSLDEVIPVYVFDERTFLGKTDHFGFPKTGKFRAQFIIESVQHLRDALQAIGSNLIVRVGKPEDEIFELAQKIKTNWVFCNRERTPDEVYVQDTLEQKLWTIGQEIRFSRGKMLYYTADLPFPITHTPDSFSQFRKEVERYVPIREPLPAPEEMAPIMVKLEEGEIPALEDLGHVSFVSNDREGFVWKGGEEAGLEYLHRYIWEQETVQEYAHTHCGVSKAGHSSRFSAWLAQGCLSPKMVYHHLRAYEQQRGASESVQSLFHSLLMRDFLRLMVKKHGFKVFEKKGISEMADPRWRDDERLLQRWIDGATGVPFIDANMVEIATTGYMSNRGRKNVSSFLVKDLMVNWQMGAEYFESVLIDYDVTSNWMNWNYAAGISADPREDKHYNIISQAMKYDPKGEYVKKWLPQLAGVPSEMIHQPDLLSSDEQDQLHLQIGADYPIAVISTDRWRVR